jgi:hypothetical protein
MKNYASCFIHEKKVNESISRYHAEGYLSGPFDKEPKLIGGGFVTNAMAAIPKAESSDIRMVVDMKRSGINRFILDKTCKFVTVDQVLKKLRSCQLMAKIDIVDAYLQVSIHPSCYRLCRIYWRNQYYFFNRLPFGAKSAPRIFQGISDMIKFGLCRRCPSSFIENYLDDFLFWNSDSKVLSRHWTEAQKWHIKLSP